MEINTKLVGELGNLVPRVLVTLIRQLEQATRTSGIKRSAMTGFFDFQFYCACVQRHVSKGCTQDSWTSSFTAHVRRNALSQRSLLPVPAAG